MSWQKNDSYSGWDRDGGSKDWEKKGWEDDAAGAADDGWNNNDEADDKTLNVAVFSNDHPYTQITEQIKKTEEYIRGFKATSDEIDALQKVCDERKKEMENGLEITIPDLEERLNGFTDERLEYKDKKAALLEEENKKMLEKIADIEAKLRSLPFCDSVGFPAAAEVAENKEYQQEADTDQTYNASGGGGGNWTRNHWNS